MATYDTNTVGSDVSPSFSPQLEIQQDVTVVNLGDGYQQRILNGLNTTGPHLMSSKTVRNIQ